MRVVPVIDAEADKEVVKGLQALKEELEERVFLLEWDIEPDTQLDLNLQASLPEGLLQRIDEALSTIYEGRIPDDPGHAFAGRDQTTVKEARALLHRFARGDQR